VTSPEHVELLIEEPLPYEMREAVKEHLKTYIYFRKEEKFIEQIVFQRVRENMILPIRCATLTQLSRKHPKGFCNKATSFSKLDY
jgi:hypothetical protein